MGGRSDNAAFSDVAPRVDVDDMEVRVLAYWEAERIFEQSVKSHEQGPRFVFYDGPPYATGKPHYGHVLQSALKDTVLRYKTMRGWHVPRTVGWDTHGLPVEVLVEKELGLKTKKEVEAYGIEQFNQKCRAAVFRYIDEFQSTLRRLGRWADYEGSYATLDRSYMAQEWGAFRALWDKQLVYQDFRSTPYCVRCETPLSNFETGMGYKERKDRAVYVKLRAKNIKTKQSIETKPLWLLVWTTTPWTLPGNVAVAFNPDILYVTVRHEEADYILARERVAALFGDKAEVVEEWKAEELAALTYEPLFPEVSEGAWKVVPADFVTTEEGTGLVHQAPAFGADDANLAKQVGLPTIRNVTTSGQYAPDAQPAWLAGQSIWEANEKIVIDLKKRGHLFKKETYSHSYPHCWRCDQPLIYYALDSWFIKVTALKARMLELNEEIAWIPTHVKHGRFGKGIASAPDWAVSRNRFWSTPLPVWECEICKHQVCVGSVEELQQLSGATDAHLEDLHRPYVDAITWVCSECRGTMRRVPEVLDVWFDSASMPYATAQDFPADFIVESIEMTRAWFYVLHVLATALKDSAAYKNVIGSGIIFGADGNKLSKKLKNYPEIEPTLKKFGADTLRLFFLSSTLGEPYVFSEKELQHLHRSFFSTLWNVYSFFVRYANTHNWPRPVMGNPKSQPSPRLRPAGEIRISNILDKWILARLAQLEGDVINTMEVYRVDAAARALAPFVDDLSNWYVRRSRPRFQPSGQASAEDSEAAFATLYEVLVRLSKLIAPFTPFVAEEMYRNLTKEVSVHLTELSEPASLSDEERDLIALMGLVREIVSAGLADRALQGIKVRQPLARLFVVLPAEVEKLSAEFVQIIQDEVNVKAVEFVDEGEGRAWVDTTLTPGLVREGIARELIRQGQVLRREANYALDDRIALAIVSSEEEIGTVVEGQRDLLMTALQANTLSIAPMVEDVGADVTINNYQVHIGVRRDN